MASVPVGRLMLRMGIPMILSMALQAVYNIVDSFFVSQMKTGGELALNAMTLAFPVQILMVAVGIGTGVGVNVLVSKSLGEGNAKRAGKTAGNGMFLCALIFVGFLVFSIFGLDFYVSTQTESAEIVRMTHDYLFICCAFSFGIVFFSIFEKLLQATGRSLYSTIAQVSGAVTNIILDPVMIYGLLGFPEMGVRGAAVATVIGQVVSCLVGLFFHFRKNSEIPFRIGFLKPSGKIVLGIYSIGFPAIVAQALMSFMTYGLNIIFNMFGGERGTAVVTAYGLFYKIQQFILFCAFGLRDAIMPIVAFNYGKQDRRRVSDGVKFGILYTLAIMLLGTLVLEAGARPFARVFGLSGMTESFCVSAMRVISLSFVFAGVNIAFQGVFQALGSGLSSLFVSFLRQFALVLPVAYILVSAVSGAEGLEWAVWTVFIFAEGVSALVSVMLFRRIGFHLRKVFGLSV